MRKLFYVLICLFLTTAAYAIGEKAVATNLDLTTPEKTIKQYFLLKSDKSLKIPEELFYRGKNTQEISYEDFDGFYRVIKTFQSADKLSPSNLYISLVSVREAGGAYYLLYLMKEDNKYLIRYWDRIFLPKPENHPDIENNLVKDLNDNVYCFGLKENK